MPEIMITNRRPEYCQDHEHLLLDRVQRVTVVLSQLFHIRWRSRYCSSDLVDELDLLNMLHDMQFLPQ
jgi:hypothetical protein